MGLSSLCGMVVVGEVLSGSELIVDCVYVLGNTPLHLACMLGHKGLLFLPHV